MRTLKVDKECLAVRHAIRKKSNYGGFTGMDFMLVDAKKCVATNGTVLIEVERSEPDEGDPVLLPRDAVTVAKRSLKKSDSFTVELVDEGKLQVRGDGPPVEFDAAEKGTVFPDYERLFRENGEDLFALGVKELEAIVKAARETGLDTVRLRRTKDDMNGFVEFVPGPHEKEHHGFRAIVRPRTEPGQVFEKKGGDDG